MAVVSPEDAATVYREHLALVTSAADPKLRLAAIALRYDRMFGKAVETVNVNETDAHPPAPILNFTPEQVKVLSDVMKATALPPEK